MAFETEIDQISALAADHPQNIALQCFDANYFRSLTENLQKRVLYCMKSGIENPDSEMGCYACQPNDYDDLRPFFAQALAVHHDVSENARHENNWSLASVTGMPENNQLDFAILGLPALSMRVRVGRNLANFPMPAAMRREDRIKLEAQMMLAFAHLAADPSYGGAYYSLTPGHPNQISEDVYRALIDDHIMFKDMSNDRFLNAAGISADWPFGRGCYVSEDRSFIIWVGEEDHLRIMCMERGTVLNRVFDRLKHGLDVVSAIDGLAFAQSQDYGIVTSCPTNLGTAMRASVHLPLPNLTADGTAERVKEIAKPLGLAVRGVGGEHTPIGKDGTVDISPSARFCITEAEIVAALYKGVARLKAEEDLA